ncbi:hypothetical protein TNCV_3744771 [Trichonephila clavipes]|nr:hypothetical protein TNCV_3744771 [Trichonephila clavipes]
MNDKKRVENGARITRVKLDGKRATARSVYTQNEGRNRRNRMKENVCNQEIPAERGGRIVKHERSIEAERRRGEERRKAVGTAESSKSRQRQSTQEPSIKDAEQGSEEML